MSKITGIGEPASELERLIAELSQSGPLIFVFGVGWWTAHLTGVTTPVFRGPADRRWWHVELGDGAENWSMDVRVDEITGQSRRVAGRARHSPGPGCLSHRDHRLVGAVSSCPSQHTSGRPPANDCHQRIREQTRD